MMFESNLDVFAGKFPDCFVYRSYYARVVIKIDDIKFWSFIIMIDLLSDIDVDFD